MTGGVHGQRRYAIRVDWGPRGAASLAPDCAALVVVDVLSFTTCVDVAVGRGAVVAPLTWPVSDAAAVPAGWRLASRDRSAALSLSPASLATIAPGTRLALPSPNGATISATAATAVRPGVPVFAGCLRNATAVAAAAAAAAGARDDRAADSGVAGASAAAAAADAASAVGIVAAGERWRGVGPGDALRPAFEDLVGAGAIADALAAGTGAEPSPEAAAAIDVFHGARDRGLAAAVRACASGQELISWGHAADVEAALLLDVSRVAPALTSVDGVLAYTAAPAGPRGGRA